MTSASGRAGQPVHGQPVHGQPATGWLSKVFALNPAELNWPRGVWFLDVAIVPLFVLGAIGYEQYFLSALFGLLFSALSDPGGSYWNRAWRIAVFGVIGAGVTALGFGVSGQAWGWLTLVTFVVTLFAGLAVAFGVRRFVVALILNLWLNRSGSQGCGRQGGDLDGVPVAGERARPFLTAIFGSGHAGHGVSPRSWLR